MLDANDPNYESGDEAGEGGNAAGMAAGSPGQNQAVLAYKGAVSISRACVLIKPKLALSNIIGLVVTAPSG